MPKVKELKNLHKEEYLVRFSLEDGSLQEFKVSTDLVVEYRLVRDKELSAEKYRSFQDDYTFDKWYQAALKYSVKYQKSEYETREYLRKKEVVEESVDKVVSKLKRMNFLNDDRLIQALIEYQFQRQLNGPEKIAFSLKRKGFEDDLVKKHLGVVSFAGVEKNLETLFERKVPTLKNKSLYSATRTMTSYLVQKGYDLNRVQAFIISHKESFLEFVDETESLKYEFHKVQKKYSKTIQDEYELKQKIIASLLSKGFTYGAIKKILERS